MICRLSRASAERAVLTAAAPLIQTRIQLLGQAPEMLGFLLTESAPQIADDALAQVSKDVTGARAVLAAATTALAALAGLGESEWRTERLEQVLRAAIVEGMNLKPRLAFAPLRVAISGRRVSPPLFESMEILGRTACLERLSALDARLGDAG